MQRLSEDYGAHTVIRALRFLQVRLSTFPESSSIATEIEQHRAELSLAQESFERAYTQRLAATAEVAYRDDIVDDAVLNLSEEALRLFDGERDDPRFSALFPVAPMEAVASTASHRQHRFVHQVIQTLLNDPSVSPLLAHATSLQEKQRALEAALEERERCFAEETQATRARNEALDEACRAYNRSYSRLQLLFRDGRRIQSLYPNLPVVRGPDSEL